MMVEEKTATPEAIVKERFLDENVNVESVSSRQFPDELIIIVEVNEEEFDRAVEIANSLDDKFDDGFVTVKKVKGVSSAHYKSVKSLDEEPVSHLVSLLNARSRTSEKQPSLKYVRDTAENLDVAVSNRNHLIFGRRGVGKTALMLETRERLEKNNAIIFWFNMQILRRHGASQAFLQIIRRIVDLPLIELRSSGKNYLSINIASEIRERLSYSLASEEECREIATSVIPDVQYMLNILSTETQRDVFIFLDDVHYIGMQDLPDLLDMIHSISRDNSVWIKAAGIRHQTRWFTDNPPTGLQTGHDATIIDLDITLEEPRKAKVFLTEILKTYTDECKIKNLSGVVTGGAIDRLVLASGGVPRDFLVLTASSIQVARQRASARSVGIQDVNEAAGQTAKVKLQELEEDAASSGGSAEARRQALEDLRSFLIEEKQFTFFRIDFKDKEQHVEEYNLMQSLMDLRVIHLVNGSLSDERKAGHRSEVYMLDLSQFSGSRFKRNLRVLDLKKGVVVLKKTGDKSAEKAGESSKSLQGILRRGPVFELERFHGFTRQE
jgi:hypothetical protein